MNHIDTTEALRQQQNEIEEEPKIGGTNRNTECVQPLSVPYQICSKAS